MGRPRATLDLFREAGGRVSLALIRTYDAAAYARLDAAWPDIDWPGLASDQAVAASRPLRHSIVVAVGKMPGWVDR